MQFPNLYPTYATPGDFGWGRQNVWQTLSLNGEPTNESDIPRKKWVNLKEDDEDSDTNTDVEMQETTVLKQIFFKKFETVQLLIERIPGVMPPIWKKCSWFLRETPFLDEITLVEMSTKSIFSNMMMYDGTCDPDDHMAQLKQHMLIIAIHK